MFAYRSVVVPPSPPGILAGVIEEARSRQLRRRIECVAAIVAAGVVATLLALMSPGGGRPGTREMTPPPAGGVARYPIPSVAPATVLGQQTGMGMACATPSRDCNLVTLGIALRTPAVAATATFDGQRLALDSRKWSDAPVNGKHRFLAGSLQPGPFLKTPPFKTLIAGIGKNGWQAPITRVHLLIDYGSGHKVQTTTSIIGFGGWG